MSKPKSILIRTAVVIAMAVTAYLTLLGFPQPLFAYSLSADHLTLHSDQPFPKESAERVLQLAAAKLAASPLYSAHQTYDIFVCNARWRQRLLFNRSYGVGGVAFYPLTRNVFLRDANIKDNQLISPLGTPILGVRTLDYFIAHELTHQLTGHAIGPVRYFQLPPYVREGYADYVGKGNSFNFEALGRTSLPTHPTWTIRSRASTSATTCWSLTFSITATGA
jgi:hypothetical protein